MCGMLLPCFHMAPTWLQPSPHHHHLPTHPPTHPLPCQVLGELVEKSGYSPQAAAELHKQLYRQKLMTLVAKKKLTEEEQVGQAGGGVDAGEYSCSALKQVGKGREMGCR